MTAHGRRSFGIFVSLSELESRLIRERIMAGVAAARVRGRKGGRKFALTKAWQRTAQAAMSNRDTSVFELCKELKVKSVTLYRYVGPKGELRETGKRVLTAWRWIPHSPVKAPGFTATQIATDPGSKR